MRISVNKVEKKCVATYCVLAFFFLKWNQYIQNKIKSTGHTVSCKIVLQLDIFTILTLNSVTCCLDQKQGNREQKHEQKKFRKDPLKV